MDEALRRWRWVPRVYLICAALLVPYAVFLAVTLPARSLSDHYRLTWVGFDVLLIIVLLRVSWHAYRRDPQVVLTATVAGALLVTDAWFDITTSAPGEPRVQALLAAALLEIPGAIVCAVLARRGLAEMVRRATHAGAREAEARQRV
ncbi:hypothetical protein G9U51_15605 [Calidifontibacter sp. DB0510]|uniref:Uncharacterized protein n=1 Tax=Metallococcus carri TaxID=1656884 RepID=A0A967EA85_9MICO|nr:hypothetical protein [Metallococcus carri]NHN57197.1 hypothetical protein [Metallococcus carri]NOP38000.1 hypothetical protein [Calidifontibacter sp. DB2511S]